MTREQAAKLIPGDRIMVTTSDGLGEVKWGTILTVMGVDADGDVLVGGGMFISDVRRVDIYRFKKRPVTVDNKPT